MAIRSDMKPGMRFGLSGCGAGLEAADPADWIELAERAERLGFSSLWINEEHFQRRDHTSGGRHCLSPLIVATAMAARTRHIRIGFSVLLLPLHRPLRLAEEIASLDVLSGGRVDFGISRGGNPRYFEAYGANPKESEAAFADALDFILKCWTANELPLGRGLYSVEPKPLQKPHPPVYVGAYSPERAAWTARAGHRLIQHGIQALPHVEHLLRAYAEAGGDLGDVPVGRFVYVGESNAAARRDLQPVIRALTARLRAAGIVRRGVIDEAALDGDRFYREMVIAGGPETCVELIDALRERLGIRYVNCLTSFFGYLPPALLQRSLERLSFEVMPRLQTATP